MEEYTHTPLQLERTEIRLLSFDFSDPSTSTSELITCRLKTFELHNCPRFVALSYTWGNSSLAPTNGIDSDTSSTTSDETTSPSSDPINKITIEGRIFLVHDNLYAALLALRNLKTCIVSEDPKREAELIQNHFWIDALCINQRDNLERGHQVKLMESIYVGASCVIAWLGPSYFQSDFIMDHIATRAFADLDIVYTSGQNWASLSDGFQKFCSLPYWCRLWIIQEFILPKNLLILCGQRGAWWESLHQCTENRIHWEAWSIEAKKYPCLGLCNARYRWQSSKEMYSLHQLLLEFRGAQCAKPEDKIYGILALADANTWGEPGPLLPDYTITRRQLYYRVIARLRQLHTLRRKQAFIEVCDRLRQDLDLCEGFEDSWLIQTLDHFDMILTRRQRQQYQSVSDPRHHVTVTYDAMILAIGIKYAQISAGCLVRFPVESYNRIVELCQSTGRITDPTVWHCFKALVRDALGLTNLDPAIMLFPLEPLPLVRYADEYARTRRKLNVHAKPWRLNIFSWEGLGNTTRVQIQDGIWEIEEGHSYVGSEPERILDDVPCAPPDMFDEERMTIGVIREIGETEVLSSDLL